MGQKRRGHYIHRLRAIYRDRQAKLSGRGIGGVDKVHQQGVVLLRGPGNRQFTVGRAHHAGQSRQGIGDGGRPLRQRFGLFALHRLRRRRAFIHRSFIGLHIYRLMDLDLGNQRDIETGGRICAQGKRLIFQRLEPMFGDGVLKVACRQPRKCDLARVVGLSALYRFPIEFYRDRGPGYWVARLIVYLDLQGLIQRPGRYNGAGNNNDGRDSSSPGPRMAHVGRLVH